MSAGQPASDRKDIIEMQRRIVLAMRGYYHRELYRRDPEEYSRLAQRARELALKRLREDP
jgi:uncharacterized protein YbjQ (UPF0145 family)